MTDWASLVGKGHWNRIRIYDLAAAGRVDDLRAILAAVRDLVPSVEDTNGVEVLLRPARPDEIVEPNEQRAKAMREAAMVLELGELEALVEGDPKPASVTWAQTEGEARTELAGLRALPEETKGSAGLSRAAHADRAIDFLDDVRKTRAIALGDTQTEEERAWVIELIAEAAQAGYWACRHAQAAIGKAVEAHAVRGIKVRKGSSDGGQIRSRQRGPETDMVLAMMEQIRADNPNLSVARAAALAHAKGLGTSAEANRQLWQAHKKRRGRKL
jgi:hypothetical protein